MDGAARTRAAPGSKGMPTAASAATCLLLGNHLNSQPQGRG